MRSVDNIVADAKHEPLLDFETMVAMKETGCRLLDVGYESGSNEILKNLKKV